MMDDIEKNQSTIIVDEDKNNPSTTNICSRFRTEYNVSFFDTIDTANGLHIDLQQSFCTNAKPFVVVLKFIMWSLTSSTLVYGWIDFEFPAFYLAFVTHWALIMAVFYQTVSLLISSNFTTTSRHICYRQHCLIKIAWISFEVVTTFELLVCSLFWIIVYDPEIDVYGLNYLNIMVHGIILLLLLIDGFILNQIPVRLKHSLIPFIFALLYLLWTILHAFVWKRNPFKDDDDYIENNDNNDDDIALYDCLKWSTSPEQASIMSVLVCLLGLPTCYILIWTISLCHRRYQVEMNENQEETFQEEPPNSFELVVFDGVK